MEIGGLEAPSWSRHGGEEVDHHDALLHAQSISNAWKNHVFHPNCLFNFQPYTPLTHQQLVQASSATPSSSSSSSPLLSYPLPLLSTAAAAAEPMTAAKLTCRTLVIGSGFMSSTFLRSAMGITLTPSNQGSATHTNAHAASTATAATGAAATTTATTTSSSTHHDHTIYDIPMISARHQLYQKWKYVGAIRQRLDSSSPAVATHASSAHHVHATAHHHQNGSSYGSSVHTPSLHLFYDESSQAVFALNDMRPSYLHNFSSSTGSNSGSGSPSSSPSSQLKQTLTNASQVATLYPALTQALFARLQFPTTVHTHAAEIPAELREICGANIDLSTKVADNVRVIVLDTFPFASYISAASPNSGADAHPPLLRRVSNSFATNDVNVHQSTLPLEPPNVVGSWGANIMEYCESQGIPAHLFVSVESRHYVPECFAAFENILPLFSSSSSSSSSTPSAVVAASPFVTFLSLSTSVRQSLYDAESSMVQRLYGYKPGMEAGAASTAGEVFTDHTDQVFA